MIRKTNKLWSLLGLVFFLGIAFLLPQGGFAESPEEIELTKKEQAWLTAHPIIRIGVDPDYAPYSFSGNNNRYHGIAMEYVRHISEQLGIRMEIVPGLSWPEIVNGVRERKLDVVATMSHRPEREAFVNFSEAYLPTPLVIMHRIDDSKIQSEADLDGHTVAMVAGYSSSTRVMEEHPRANPLNVKTALGGLLAVASGKADAYVGVLGINVYLMHEKGINNLRVASLYGEGTNAQHFGVRKDWPELASILDKALKAIPQEQKQRMHERWLFNQDLSIPSGRERIQQSDESTVTPQLKIIIGLSVLTLIIFIGLVFLLGKLSWEESLSRLFGSISFRRNVILAQAIFSVAVVILTWWVIEDNRQQLSNSRQVELGTILNSTNERLDIWVDTQLLLLEEHTERSELVSITEQLLAVPPDTESLKKSSALKAIRAFDHKHFNFFDSDGFFVINPDRISIGSMRDSNLGTTNLIEQQHPALLDKAFQGETVFVPPIRSDVPLQANSNNATDLEPTMFIASPIRNRQGEVIAVLVKRLDPTGSFSKVLNHGRFGSSGESYAFDQTGRLISESRFNHHLIQIGLLELDQHSSLNIQIRDPGGNLLEGFQSSTSRDAQPLTRMAATAVRGVAGSDLNGYRDYRGVPVVGTWLWNDKLNIGLATEIDVEEAFATYYVMLWTIFGLLGLVLIIAVGGITFTLFLGEKASRVLRRSRDELEDQVHERTQNLKQEIQERKQAEVKLQASEAEYRDILESLQDLYFRTDIEGRIVRVSPSAQYVTGYRPEELIGKQSSIFWRYPEKRLEMFKAMQADDGAVQNLEVEGIHKDGSIVWASINAHYYRDEKGDIAGVEGTIRDVSTGKQAEADLQASESRLNFLLSNGPVVIYTCSATPPFGATYISPNIMQQMGFKSEQFTKNSGFWAEHIHPEDSERVFEDLSKLFDHGIHVHEYRFRMNDGNYRWMRDELTLIRDETGEPIEIVGYWADITDRREAEMALEVQEERLRRAQNFANIGTWDLNIRTGDLIWSERIAALFGHHDTGEMETTYENFLEAIHPDDRQAVIDAVNACLEQDMPYEIEHRVVWPDGTVRWLMERGAVLRNADGEALQMLGVVQDIDDSKRAELALQESQIKLSGLFELSPLGIALTDMSGSYLEFNEAFRKICGYPANELKTLDYWTLTPKEYEEQEAAQLELLEKTGRYGPYEKVYRQKNGNLIPIRLNGMVVKDHDGQPRIWSIVEDITRSKAAEQALQQSEQRIRAILDTVVDGIITLNDKGIVQTFNPAAERIFGYPADEVLGKNVSLLMPEPYQSQHVSYITNYHQTGDFNIIGTEREVIGKKKDGTTFPMDLALSEMEVNGHRVFTGVARDITERQAMQKRLKQQTKLLNMLHHSTTSFVEKGDFSQTMNDMLDTLLELTHSEYGFTGEVLYDDEDKPYLKTHAITNIAWNPETEALYEENAAKGFEFRNLDTLFGYVLTSRETVVSNNPASDPRAGGLPKGHPAMNSFLGVPIFYGDELVGMYGISNRPGGYDEDIQAFLRPFDTTYGVLIDSKRMEDQEDNFRQALIESKHLAERANQAKSAFLSSMSHELRTPLNAIMGFAQLFEYEQDLSEDQKANAREIHKAGNHLLALINEVLDLAKIESGYIELSMEVVPLSKVLKESRHLINSLAETHGISLDFELSQCNNLFVKVDYTRLKQVLLNLMSNAIKYNRKDGYVSIKCATDNADSVRVSIRDTGLGISEDKLSKLFQPFNRLGAEFGSIEGTGIGLVITKQLVELMGGTIGVDSIAGKGSTFWIELQTTQSSEYRHDFDDADSKPDTDNSQEALPAQARILIAEDNMANQQVLQQQMELLGLRADFVENGIKAWEHWQKGEYDLLLTDIQMPLMNGYELVDRIRKAEQLTGEHKPIIAITANAMEEDAKRCLDNGMDAFVAKPINIDELQATLKKWLPENEANTPKPDLPVNTNVDRESNWDADTDQLVDISMLINQVGDNHDKHCLLFKSFIDSSPEIIHAIHAGYQDHAAETIKQQAHKLKSSARSMGAHGLADVCQALESAGKENHWDEIDSLVPQLNELFESVNAYMKNYCRSAQIPEPASKLSVEQLKILLIDDDRVMLDVETMMLNELGIDDVFTSISGEDALSIIDDLNNSIDVVMCDLNMPEMDGVEFLRHLAKKNYVGAVVLVSGEETRILKAAERLAAEHRLKVLGVLEKPVAPAEVMHMLGKLEKTSSKTEQKPTTQQQILITVEELQHGIENDELVTFFQPKVNVVSREVVGMETLVRWQHPEKGMIVPDLFIPLAEENGLIDTLTQAVFEQAMQHVANLQASGFNIKVAVNISVDTLNDLDWPDYAIAQASNAGVDPSNITLEITESRLMDNLTSALEIITRLSMKKFKLSVDDFGTGYSSMEQLQRVPFSELKIDRAFVNGATHDKSSRAILESSIDLARKLDMSIVAEGVETQEDWDLLAELGCDQIQGYFIAKPMPIDELKHWLRQWKK